MPASQYPSTASPQNPVFVLNAPASGTIYDIKQTIPRGIWTVAPTSGTILTLDTWYQGAYVTSYTISTSTNININYLTDQLVYSFNTGSNSLATITYVSGITSSFPGFSTLSGNLITLTSSNPTYNGGSGLGYVVAISGGGGGATGGGTTYTTVHYTRYGSYTTTDQFSNGGGGSGNFAYGHLNLTSNMQVVIGTGGSGAVTMSNNASPYSGNSGSTGGTTSITSAGTTISASGGTGAAAAYTYTTYSGRYNSYPTIHYVNSVGGTGAASGASGYTGQVGSNPGGLATTTAPWSSIQNGYIAGGSGTGSTTVATGTLGTGGSGQGGNATGYGSGGGGASGGVTGTGGNGSQGIIYIMKYAS